jgi:glycosyltransferase involved in cell wall biosynthesis
MLASAVGIIGNSQATLDSLQSFADNASLSVPMQTAAPLGIEDHLGNAAALKRPERPTFVVLGTIEGRKNHLLLLQIWQRLVQAHGMAAPRLLVIGQRGWECAQVFDLLDRREILRGVVTEVSHCTDAELNGHLTSATALLFPSFAEGYGLPLVEALNAGAPVIASDLPVFREIGQGVPDFLNPLDEPAWEEAILSYAEDGSARRDAQIGRLAGYRAPTWDAHFDHVEAWLAKL